MSVTLIIVLTAAVASGFGHPLHLLKHNRLEIESSIPVNISSWNISQANKNETEVFPMEGDAASQTLGNDTDASTFMVFLPKMEILNEQGPPVRSGCPLPTCLTDNLVSSLQTGDEKAGKSTSDPLGNGKK